MNMKNKIKLIIVVIISLILFFMVIFDSDNALLNSVAIEDDSEMVKTIEGIRDNIELLKGKTEQQIKQKKQQTAKAKQQAGDFGYVLVLNKADKMDFLNELLNILNANKSKKTLDHKLFKDAKVLSIVLAQLALDDNESVSYAALKLINLLAWAPHTVGLKPNVTPSDKLPSGLPDFRQSDAMKASLTQLIGDTHIDDEVKSYAITAHALLYPPDDTIISQFEQMISQGGLDQGDTLTAIFTAFTHYKRLHNYDMPASTLEITKTLMDHPSDSVKSDVISQLRRSIGEPVVPVLIDQLKQTGSPSMAHHLIMNILMINPSEEVVRQLKEIAENNKGSGKEIFINRATNDNNIKSSRERYNARKAAQEAG